MGGRVTSDAGAPERAGESSADAGASAAGTAANGGHTGESSSAGAPPDDDSGGATSTADWCVLASADGLTPLNQSTTIGRLYRAAIGSDCRYTGLKCGVDGAAKVIFANALYYYGYNLWQCDGTSATTFQLVYEGQKVTPTDADALIDLYVAQTLTRLPLTDNDARVLRDQLRVLAAPSIDPEALGISQCDSGAACPGSAGAGGTGGAGSSGAADGGDANTAGAE